VAGVVAGALVVSRAGAADPNVTAKAAVIVDAASGELLWEKNAHLAVPPASTTKILTAILAIESGRLDDSVGVSARAAETAPSKIGLRPGDRMAVGDLLYAVLLNSANDAASVVAEGLAGSETAFAARMNAKARAIGARDSHFVNPHGLTEDGHVSSAADLAALFRYGLSLREFREILETPRIKVPVESRRISSVTLHSHNRLLSGWEHRVIGKTGYTRPAGRCFVGAATSGGREVIIALLGATDLWGDARRLFEHAFGESTNEPAVQMAAVSRRNSGRRPIITTEGDEDLNERFRSGQVHMASVDRKGTHTVSTGTRSVSAETLSVRLGPYAKRREAESARDRLARQGYRGRVVGQVVLLGQFSSRSSADKLAKGLRAKGYRPTIVAAR
jgi:D-alanyl-D-alanine carboxypeptidase